MIETQRHLDAFEHYFSLGAVSSTETRKIITEKCNICDRTFWVWYKNFNWKYRIEQRNIEISKELAKTTNKEMLNTKADYRREVRGVLSILKTAVSDVIKKMPNGKRGLAFKIEDIQDLTRVLKSYKELATLDLDLIGVSVGDETTNITINIENDDSV